MNVPLFSKGIPCSELGGGGGGRGGSEKLEGEVAKV